MLQVSTSCQMSNIASPSQIVKRQVGQIVNIVEIMLQQSLEDKSTQFSRIIFFLEVSSMHQMVICSILLDLFRRCHSQYLNKNHSEKLRKILMMISMDESYFSVIYSSYFFPGLIAATVLKKLLLWPFFVEFQDFHFLRFVFRQQQLLWTAFANLLE